MRVPLTALLAALATVLSSFPSAALSPEPDAVFVRIIDTGPGHAAVIRMPGDFYMVYDTGHWSHQGAVLKCVKELIPTTEEIDLMVLSHSDSDHLAVTDEIFAAYTVKRVWRTGLERTTGTWGNADTAIRAARAAGTTDVYNLRQPPWGFGPGSALQFGDVYVTFVVGHYWPPDSTNWNLPGNSKKRNAGSIVTRLNFNGKTILFTGDAVGRLDGTPPGSIIATEKFMVDNAASVPIQSDVLIAPHHGADNGSSLPFIKAVDPTYVIFPSGNAHGHPKHATAMRYLDGDPAKGAGIPPENVFRTDLGDDETDEPDEWKADAEPGGDSAGDDHVDVLIRPNGEIVVEYRGEACGP